MGTSRTAPPASRFTAPGVFVGGAWLASAAGAVAYVLRFASPLPFQDEWDALAQRYDGRSFAAWLWSPHNEHRLPLPRLVWAGLLDVGGGDARVACLATVAVLAGLALACLVAVRRLRGRTEFADAYFPLLLLNVGHFENLRMGYQVGFALSVALAVGVALLGLKPWTAGRAALAGVGVALLPLCGSHGLIYGAALAAWLAVDAVRLFRKSRGVATLLAGAVVVFAVVVVAYLHDLPRGTTAAPAWGDAATVAGQCLSLAGGWVGSMAPTAALAAILAAVAVTAVLLARSWSAPPVLPLAALAVGTLLLAAAIGWGRAPIDPTHGGFAVRYALLMAPLMVAVYFAWAACGGTVGRELVPMLLFVAVTMVAPQHVRTGWAEGKHHIARCDAAAAALKAGPATPTAMAAHPHLHPNPDWLARDVAVLRAHKFGGVP